MTRSLTPPMIALAASTVLTVAAPSAQAAEIYRFVQDGTNETLAFLELSSLPATESEVASLTFTPAGDDIFGFGPTYAGAFDSALESFVDDGSGILVSSVPAGGANVTDSNPPPSTTIVGDVLDFIIGTSDPLEPVDTLVVFLNAEPPVFAMGSFERVPEPSTACLAGVALAAIGARRRR